jgi:hypothetical protein
MSKVPKEILNPKVFFESKGRADLYKTWVEKMKTEREAFLNQFNVDADIVKAVANR